MEWLQALLDNSSTPVLTAFLLGLLTAISPCPLATNIAAIGYIGKDMESRRHVFLNGLLYTAGRIVAYTVLGLLLILIIRQGASMFGIQKFIGTWGEMLLGPALIVADAIQPSAQLATVRLQWKQRRRIEKAWRLGSIPLGCIVCYGLLPYERYVLLRNAHSHVCYYYDGLSAACSVRPCHSLASTPQPCQYSLSPGCWRSACRRLAGSTAG